MREAPHDPARHAHLGAVLAGLGRKEDAINEGKKAVELLPNPKTLSLGHKRPLRSPKFMLGSGNTMKQFVYSIIC